MAHINYGDGSSGGREYILKTKHSISFIWLCDIILILFSQYLSGWHLRDINVIVFEEYQPSEPLRKLVEYCTAKIKKKSHLFHIDILPQTFSSPYLWVVTLPKFLGFICWEDSSGASLMVWCKGSTSNAGDTRKMGSISRLGRSPGERNDNPLQYSCLGNLMDRRAWQVIESMGSQTARHNLETKQQHSSEQIFWGIFGYLSAWSVWSVRGNEKLAGSSCLCQCYHFSGAKCDFLQPWKRARMEGLSRLTVWREVGGFHSQRLEGATPREDATAEKGNVAPKGKARWLQLPPTPVNPMGWSPHGWWKYTPSSKRLRVWIWLPGSWPASDETGSLSQEQWQWREDLDSPIFTYWVIPEVLWNWGRGWRKGPPKTHGSWISYLDC